MSLPAGGFVNAGAGVKTNLLFFTKGRRTESIWYYDLSDVKVGKKKTLTIERFERLFELLPTRGDGDRSWTVTRAEIEAKNYDLKAVNPTRKVDTDTRTPSEILGSIEARQVEIDSALRDLRRQIPDLLPAFSECPSGLSGAARSRTRCFSSVISGNRPSSFRDQTTSPPTLTTNTPPASVTPP